MAGWREVFVMSIVDNGSDDGDDNNIFLIMMIIIITLSFLGYSYEGSAKSHHRCINSTLDPSFKYKGILCCDRTGELGY